MPPAFKDWEEVFLLVPESSSSSFLETPLPFCSFRWPVQPKPRQQSYLVRLSTKLYRGCLLQPFPIQTPLLVALPGWLQHVTQNCNREMQGWVCHYFSSFIVFQKKTWATYCPGHPRVLFIDGNCELLQKYLAFIAENSHFHENWDSVLVKESM